MSVPSLLATDHRPLPLAFRKQTRRTAPQASGDQSPESEEPEQRAIRQKANR